MTRLLPLLLLTGFMAGEDLDLTIGRTRWHLAADAATARAAREALPVWRRGRARLPGERLLLTRTLAFRGPPELAAAAGLAGARPGALPGVVLAEAAHPLAAVAASGHLLRLGAAWAEPQLHRPRTRRTDDPRFTEQWHLANDGHLAGAVAGNDINSGPAWAAGFHGEHRLIAIIDGAFDRDHEDLSAVWRTDLALRVATGGSDPWLTAGSTDIDHATFCASLAAARGENRIGIAGVAHQARVVPIDLLTADSTDAHEATALSHAVSDLDVSSNSWGPPDTGVITDGPGSQTQEALELAVTQGRGGLGTVVVWAAGNGRDREDTLAYDGYASDPRVLAIGASTIDGLQADYSEGGPALLAVAPGGDHVAGMVGARATSSTPAYSTSADGESGTSFAAPVAAGVAALVIQAHPTLTWREVRHHLALTASRDGLPASGWQEDGGGRPWHPGFGFGRLDAGAAVTTAPTRLPAAATPLVGSWSGSLAVPDNVEASGAAATVTFAIAGATDYRLESTLLTLGSSHTAQGDLEVTLTDPGGRTAVVPVRTFDDTDTDPSAPVTFHAVGFLDRDPNGTWTVAVRDRLPNDQGRITSVRLELRGYRLGGATSNDQGTPAPGSGSSPAGSGVVPVASGGGGGGGGCGAGGALAALVGVLAIGRRKLG